MNSLSPEGLARRGAMLQTLCAAVVRRRRRRRAVRGGVAVVLIAGALRLLLPGGGGEPTVSPPGPAADFPVAVTFKYIDVEIIDDDGLLELVNSKQGPTGLIRVANRAFLSTDIAALGQSEAGSR